MIEMILINQSNLIFSLERNCSLHNFCGVKLFFSLNLKKKITKQQEWQYYTKILKAAKCHKKIDNKYANIKKKNSY